VRDANDRSERRDIWPGARGEGECVSWRRRREHESSSSSARGEASEQQASSSSQRERENRREDFPAKITSCPDLSSRQTPNNKVNIAWNDHAVRSRELQQICPQSYRRGQVRIVQPPFHNSHLATLKESTDRENSIALILFFLDCLIASLPPHHRASHNNLYAFDRLQESLWNELVSRLLESLFR